MIATTDLLVTYDSFKTVIRKSNDFEEESANSDIFFFKEELIDITFKVKSTYTYKEIEYYLMNDSLEQNIPSFVQLLRLFYILFKVFISWNLDLAMRIMYIVKRETLWI